MSVREIWVLTRSPFVWQERRAIAGAPIHPPKASPPGPAPQSCKTAVTKSTVIRTIKLQFRQPVAGAGLKPAPTSLPPPHPADSALRRVCCGVWDRRPAHWSVWVKSCCRATRSSSSRAWRRWLRIASRSSMLERRSCWNLNEVLSPAATRVTCRVEGWARPGLLQVRRTHWPGTTERTSARNSLGGCVAFALSKIKSGTLSQPGVPSRTVRQQSPCRLGRDRQCSLHTDLEVCPGGLAHHSQAAGLLVAHRHRLLPPTIGEAPRPGDQGDDLLVRLCAGPEAVEKLQPCVPVPSRGPCRRLAGNAAQCLIVVRQVSPRCAESASRVRDS